MTTNVVRGWTVPVHFRWLSVHVSLQFRVPASLKS
jgi:hypothetical protein